jgi:DHA2 family methylenomycin A resistance protein-like MFS transporter
MNLQQGPAAAPAAAKSHRSALAHSLTLAATSLGYGVVQLDVTIVNTALDAIGKGLGGDITKLQWVVSSYTVAFAAFILTAGGLGDRIGAKRVFLAGFAFFTAASLGCALACTAPLLIAARTAQGFAAAILVPNSLALLNHTYPSPAERSRAVGIWAAGASLALTAGPLAGGILIALAGWRSIFLVNLPIGLVGLYLSWRYAEETPRSPQRELDPLGQAAAIGTLGSLAWALIEGGHLGWTHPWVESAFALAMTLGLLFVWQERRAHQAMLPLSLFKERLFSLTAAVGLVVNIAFYGLIFVFSLYFQRINHLSPFATGLAFLPMMGAVLPANLLAARIAARLGAIPTIALGAGIAAAGAAALLRVAAGTAYVEQCAQLIALGVGLGLLVPPLTSTLLGSVDRAHSGIAAGVLNSTRQTGSVLGVALFGSLLGQGEAFVRGTHEALLISTLLLAGGAVGTLLVGRRPTAVPEPKARS